MTTQKLFYEDPYQTEFTAQVLRCEQRQGGWDVVLDRSCFYPEGGGQPCDTGTLGLARVTDVHEREGAGGHRCPFCVLVGPRRPPRVEPVRPVPSAGGGEPYLTTTR